MVCFGGSTNEGLSSDVWLFDCKQNRSDQVGIPTNRTCTYTTYERTPTQAWQHPAIEAFFKNGCKPTGDKFMMGSLWISILLSH